MKEQDAFDV